MDSTLSLSNWGASFASSDRRVAIGEGGDGGNGARNFWGSGIVGLSDSDGVRITCGGSRRDGACAVGALDSSGEPPGRGDELPGAELPDAGLPDAELLGGPAEGRGDDTGGGARGGGGGSLGEVDDTWERNNRVMKMKVR